MITPAYRLRQVALVVSDLDAAEAEFERALGLKVGYRDPGVAKYGLRNAILPVGGDFIELVGCLDDRSSAARYLARRGGDAGYMLILQSDDAVAHRKRLADLGLFGIEYMGGEPHGAHRPPVDDPELAAELERFAEIHHATHFHPRDTAGVLASIDSVPGIADWQARFSDWFPAGYGWRDAVSDNDAAIVGATIQARDPDAAAAMWSRFLGLPVQPNREIALEGSRLRFVPPIDTDGTGIIGLDLAMSRPDATARICGLTINLST